MEQSANRDFPSYTEQEVWEKYLDVTREMLKFINRNDVDTFLSIVSQRDILFEMLKSMEPHIFAKTEEGTAIREQIKTLDVEIMYKARAWLNKSKRQNVAVKSYDSTAGIGSGNVFNREY